MQSYAPCWKAYLFSTELINHSCGIRDLFCLRGDVRKFYICSESKDERFLSIHTSIIPTIIFWISSSSFLVHMASYLLPQSNDLLFHSLGLSESLWDLREFAVFCLSLVVLFFFPPSKLYYVQLHTELQSMEG